MIVRMWRGATRREDANRYVDYVRSTGHAAFRETEGNLGSVMLRRIEADRAEFLVMSFWRDLESVRRFAGESYERAVFYAEDDKYLIARDEHTEHYEVMELELSEALAKLT